MQNLQKTKQLGQEREVGVNDPASISQQVYFLSVVY